MHRLLHGTEAGRDFSTIPSEVRGGLNAASKAGAQIAHLAKSLGKGTGIFALIGFYVASASTLHLVFKHAAFTAKRRQLIGRLISFVSKRALRLANINVEAHYDDIRRHDAAGRLVLANHLSYVDVLVLSSLYDGLYVTSVEVEKSLGLGHLARLGGCLFVERRRKFGLPQEIERLKGVLQSGIDLTIFPEGTSSNGDGILPFKSSLLATAAAGCRIQPICIKYESINDRQPDHISRDCVYWYGTMGFLSHLWRLVQLESVQVKVRFLSELVPQPQETRAALSQRAHQAISTAYFSSSGSYLDHKC